MSDLEPDEYPFGQTEYLNYDPEQVNTPEEAVDLLEWVADQNDSKGKHKAAAVFRDAAHAVEVTLVEESDA